MAPPAPTDGDSLVLRWSHHGRHVATARQELGKLLAAWGMAGLADPAVLVLSELFGNAVRHARAPRDRLIETWFVRLPGAVRIEVHDADCARPVMRRAGEDDEAGRGLAMIDRITHQQWGVSDREGVGKRVWAVVSCDQADDRPHTGTGTRNSERSEES